ncbi:uncharacterized protein LOC128226807 [Mya arenaria]|uniref:uncharacterized protein LOC128226807 n=1 Tax=Mya arenaria TaxID=6604 RepID=UPI0022E6704F|nr:uncharacterized protein LOC128226807 [Mya arenaria]
MENTTPSLSMCEVQDVFTCSQARSLLCIRQTLRRSARVTIHGSVLFLSGLVAVKDTQLFLVRLEQGVNIIVKKSSYLYWQKELELNEDYVFTELIPTSLQKGSREQHLLYAVSDHSQLHEASKVRLTLVNIDHWLTSHRRPVTNDALPGDYQLDNGQAETEDKLDVFSYQGMVTAVLDASVGVFELDGKVRLYAGHLHSSTTDQLKTGQIVLVQNAHYRLHTKHSMLSLYCCILASVSVIEGPTADQNIKTQSSDGLRKQIYTSSLSQAHMDLLGQLRLKLNLQFLSGFGQKFVDKLFSRLLSTDYAQHVKMDGRSRNAIDEFLTLPHQCGLMVQGEEIQLKMCSIADIQKVKLADSPAVAVEGKDATDWCANIKALPDMEIPCIIDTCRETGQLILHDNTGRIGVVVCCLHSNHSDKTASLATCVHGGKTGENSASLVNQEQEQLPEDKYISENKSKFCMDTSKQNEEHSFEKCESEYTRLKNENLEAVEGNSGNSADLPSKNEQKGIEMKHICDMKCKCDSLQPGQSFTCPFVHKCCLGKAVLVKKCYVGEELKLQSKVDLMVASTSKRSSKPMEKKCLYLFVDLRYVFFICHSSRKSESSASVSGHLQGLEMDRSTSVFQKETPMLHTHEREDGGTIFCRKKECYVKKTPGKCEINSENKNTSVEYINRNDTLSNVMRLGARSASEEKLADSCFKSSLSNTSKSQGKVFTPKFVVKGVKRCHVRNKDKHVRKTTLSEKCVLNEKQNIDEHLSLTTVDNSKLRVVIEGSSQTENSNHSASKLKLISKKCDLSDINRVCELTKVVIHVENRGSVQDEKIVKDGKHMRQFYIDCELVTGDKTFKVCLQFPDGLIRYHAVISPGAFYLLTVPSELSPLLALNISNVKVQKAALKSKTRLLLSVNDHADIQEAWNDESSPWQPESSPWQHLVSLTALLQTGFSDTFVSFEGFIVKRSYTNISTDARTVDISTRQCVRILVQDCSLEHKKIWVYINERDVPIPLGLIPGVRLVCHALERRVAKGGNVYCKVLPFSSLHVLCYNSDHSKKSSDTTLTTMDIDFTSLPTHFLSDTWTMHTGSAMFQCTCDVTKVSRVSLKCICAVCGSVLMQGLCTSEGCGGGDGYAFSVRASVVVDDGTSVAMVTLTGNDVRSLLQLSHDQWACLQEEVAQVGEVFVQQVRPVLDTPLHQFVYQLCESGGVKQTWVMALKLSRVHPDVNNMDASEFVWKDFDTGTGHISTQCLPFLHLHCERLALFQPEALVHNYMGNQGTV